ncbi:hypothetical protein NIES2101_25745 [Calothrix sp. HK-06]|nr:hypothetical protein NIES2101_25745 [Calothrix sp. HK-06]
MKIFTEITGYKVSSLLYKGSRTLIYRGLREADQKPVVIKLLNNAYPTLNELVKFRNQYTISKNLEIPEVVQVYSLESYQNGYALVMEDFGGISLHDYTKKNTFDLLQFLIIAVKLSDILDKLHRNKVIHKDIKPANILINPETKQIKLADFSIASLLLKETQEIIHPNVLEGTLAYVSPEQTGRMNRGIDYRTDFYSLGVSFYELLTGKLPFISDDAMELVHCHIARHPVPVHSLQPEIPEALSNIVAKLMAKNAENRYQTALGLKTDLETCLHQLKETGIIREFAIAQQDMCNRFIIPEKLYGREQEVNSLLSAFQRVSQGATELLLVAGSSGIGKTAVVNEVHKPIVAQRGYFIKGKYDQFQRNIPLFAFVQAFQDLMGQLLSESDEQLKQWKHQIISAVGENGQVLIEVIPELERIIGEQPPVPYLSASSVQNRFNLLFQKFTQVFCSPEHPLVIFLDDLQWADATSLKLLQLLMSDAKHLLIIGAYRNNEVSSTHPFILAVDEIQKKGATIGTITLQPLGRKDVNQLITDTLNCNQDISRPLEELVYQKTQGNPFFASQFIKALHADGLITFNCKNWCWQCDMARVRVSALTDDIVEFMARQLQKLPAETQHILKFAACIGAQFDLMTLATVLEKSLATTAAQLWKGLLEGFVIPKSETYKFFQSSEVSFVDVKGDLCTSYRFLHDRVQQAAYLLIPKHQRQIVHLHVGQLILQNTSSTELDEKLFDIANHLNIGAKSLVHAQSERVKIAELNLLAGQKAKLSTAYEVGVKYLTAGVELLNSNWDNNYDLMLSLHKALIECAYLAAQFTLAESYARTAIAKAKSHLDQASINVIRLVHYQNSAAYEKAIHIGLDSLQLFGLELPVTPDRDTIQLAAQEASTSLGERKIEDLISVPMLEKPEHLILVELLVNLIPPTYIANQSLMVLVILKMTTLCLKYGNTQLSSFVYIWYGTVLCAIFGEYCRGEQFGTLGLKFYEQSNNLALKGRLYMSFANFISHWRRPIIQNLELPHIAYQAALEAGDFSWCHHSALFSFWQHFISSKSLDELANDYNRYISFAQKSELTAAKALELQNKILINLQATSSSYENLNSQQFDEASALHLFEESRYDYGACTYYFAKAFLFFCAANYADAYQMGLEVEKYLGTLYSQFQITLHYFYQSLNLVHLYATATEQEKQQYYNKLQEYKTKLKTWADNCPENFSAQYYLLEAELFQIEKDAWNASKSYDLAIEIARKNGLTYFVLLSNELAAQFYFNWNKPQIAQAYLMDAYYGYACWGAKSKVLDLEQRYPQLLDAIVQNYPIDFKRKLTIANNNFTTQTSSSKPCILSDSATSIALDLETIIKGCQALSSEIEQDKLLATLLKLVITNAGADKCAFVRVEASQLIVEAISYIEITDNIAFVMPGVLLDNCIELPIRLVTLVKRCLQPAIISNANNHPLLGADPYILYQRPKSMLCMPIQRKDKLLGLLYLENRETESVFTQDRLSILNLLCSQAAISLENALLYKTLEEKVAQRTGELHEKNTSLQQTLAELQQTQIQLIQSEKMSSLGHLVAGIAHEINNPVSFIHGNLKYISEYTEHVLGLLQLYQKYYTEPVAEIQSQIEAIDLDFLREDLHKILSSINIGSERIRDIIKSLRIFSRLDEAEYKTVDIHQGLDSTLMILENRITAKSKYPGIEIIKEYGELPPVECYAGQLNQVFMHILVNAIDALEERNKQCHLTDIIENPSKIYISTSFIKQENNVIITIKDNGNGIPENVQKLIFNPFFTTKEVGKGRGLGMAISYEIITNQHKGSLKCISHPGNGACFEIKIPTAQ